MPKTIHVMDIPDRRFELQDIWVQYEPQLDLAVLMHRADLLGTLLKSLKLLKLKSSAQNFSRSAPVNSLRALA